MSHRTAIIMIVICATLWSMGGLLIKSVPLHPLAISGARSLIAGLVLWIYHGRMKFTWSKAQIAAAISFTLTVILFVMATKMTTAANAILLQYTAPIHVAVFGAPLLGERVHRRDWITLAVVILGMLLFFIEDVSTEHLIGNVVALASGISFAGIAVSLRMQKRRVESRIFVFGAYDHGGDWTAIPFRRQR